MSDQQHYPDEALRGIPNDSFIHPDGETINASMFYFEPIPDSPCRIDQCNEVSINWNDAPEALRQLLSQKKIDSEEIQFKSGAAVLLRSQIDNVRIQSRVNGKLMYERKIENDNIYHGNLLLKNDVPKPMMKMIAASISLCVDKIIKNS